MDRKEELNLTDFNSFIRFVGEFNALTGIILNKYDSLNPLIDIETKQFLEETLKIQKSKERAPLQHTQDSITPAASLNDELFHRTVHLIGLIKPSNGYEAYQTEEFVNSFHQLRQLMNELKELFPQNGNFVFYF